MQNSRLATGLNLARGWLGRSDRVFAVDCLMFGSIALFGLLRLAEPLWGDQALFVVGAQTIHQGGLLYRDFWDLKPPGIYGLYTLAGSLFGFTSVGVHTVDYLWMLTLAIVLRRTLTGYFKRQWIASVVPWLMVGSYFALTDFRQQMQVESLIGLPLYLVIWLTLQAAQQPAKRWRWLMLSGVMGGIVMLFKLIYLPLLLALWLVYLIHIVRQRQPIVPALWQTSWPLAVGGLLPIVPVLLYWQSQGMLGEVFYILVQHPSKLVQTLAPRPISGLVRSVGWFAVKFSPILVLAGFGIYRNLRRLSLLTAQLIAWLGLGLGMILLQSQSWWTYHLMLLLVPLTILAGDGIDWLVDAVRSAQRQGKTDRQYWKVVLGGCLGGLAVMQLWATAIVSGNMLQSTLPLTPAMQLQYQIQAAPSYRAVDRDVQFVRRAESLPGPIYVIGSPIVYLLADRAQAVALNGWIPEILLPEQWRQLETQLATARPNYIFVSLEDDVRLEDQFKQFLQQRYGVAQRGEFGTWYQIHA
jgi:Dolichyl-phosphate-mannose-protein mannosyltransferase